jgi:hypothetical protein
MREGYGLPADLSAEASKAKAEACEAKAEARKAKAVGERAGARRNALLSS